MEKTNKLKSFYKDKTMEEFNYDTKKWKKQIEFLLNDFDFITTLLDSNIYNSNHINLFENLQLYKAQIKDVTTKCSEILNKLISHEKHIEIYLECDDINCDYFFLEGHAKTEYTVTLLIEESNHLKMQLFEYIKSVILK